LIFVFDGPAKPKWIPAFAGMTAGRARASHVARRAPAKLRVSPEPFVTARLVLCTCPDAPTASRLARTLVDERLAACVNVIGAVTSTYRWNGEVHVDDEALLVIKTMADRFEALESRLVALHPYDVPEVLAIEPAAGAAPYLAWLERETRPA
jgi:periplasmic divalent cation tolerance protein